MTGPHDWQMLWRLKELERKSAAHDKAIRWLRKQVALIKETIEEARTWGLRLLLVMGWWGGGTYLNMSAEEKAQMGAQLLLGLIGR